MFVCVTYTSRRILVCIFRLNLYINFNNAIRVTVPHDMTLDLFKIHIFDQLIPGGKNPKIYFNGLLLKDDDQTLAKYGITNQSALYINTENIVGTCQNRNIFSNHIPAHITIPTAHCKSFYVECQNEKNFIPFYFIFFV